MIDSRRQDLSGRTEAGIKDETSIECYPVNRAALLFLLFLTACHSSVKSESSAKTEPSVILRIVWTDENWEMGEVKSCLPQHFKDGVSLLTCSTEAGADFLLTSAAIDRAKNAAERSRLEGAFLFKTKEFQATLEDPPQGAPAMWDCQRTPQVMRCTYPRPQSKRLK